MGTGSSIEGHPEYGFLSPIGKQTIIDEQRRQSREEREVIKYTEQLQFKEKLLKSQKKHRDKIRKNEDKKRTDKNKQPKDQPLHRKLSKLHTTHKSEDKFATALLDSAKNASLIALQQQKQPTVHRRLSKLHDIKDKPDLFANALAATARRASVSVKEQNISNEKPHRKIEQESPKKTRAPDTKEKPNTVTHTKEKPGDKPAFQSHPITKHRRLSQLHRGQDTKTDEDLFACAVAASARRASLSVTGQDITRVDHSLQPLVEKTDKSTTTKKSNQSTKENANKRTNEDTTLVQGQSSGDKKSKTSIRSDGKSSKPHRRLSRLHDVHSKPDEDLFAKAVTASARRASLSVAEEQDITGLRDNLNQLSTLAEGHDSQRQSKHEVEQPSALADHDYLNPTGTKSTLSAQVQHKRKASFEQYLNLCNLLTSMDKEAKNGSPRGDPPITYEHFVEIVNKTGSQAQVHQESDALTNQGTDATGNETSVGEAEHPHLLLALCAVEACLGGDPGSIVVQPTQVIQLFDIEYPGCTTSQPEIALGIERCEPANSMKNVNDGGTSSSSNGLQNDESGEAGISATDKVAPNSETESSLEAALGPDSETVHVENVMDTLIKSVTDVCSEKVSLKTIANPELEVPSEALVTLLPESVLDIQSDVPLKANADVSTETTVDALPVTTIGVPAEADVAVPQETTEGVLQETTEDGPTDVTTGVPPETTVDVLQVTNTGVPPDAGAVVVLDATEDDPAEATNNVPPETTAGVPPETSISVPPDENIDVHPKENIDTLPETTIDVPSSVSVQPEATIDVPPKTTKDVPSDTAINVPSTPAVDDHPEATIDVPSAIDVPLEQPKDIPQGATINVPQESAADVPDTIGVETDAITNVPIEATVNIPTEANINVPSEENIDVQPDTIADVPNEATVNILTEADINVPPEENVDVPIETIADILNEAIANISSDIVAGASTSAQASPLDVSETVFESCNTDTAEESAIASEDASCIKDAPVPTEEPSIVTEESAIDTEESVIVTEESAIVIDKPAIITEDPAIVSEEPAIITGEPAIVIEKPAIITEKPAVVTEELAINTEEPSIVTEESAIDTEEPVIVTEEPAIVIDKPAIITEEAAIVTEQPADVTEEPAIVTEKPAIDTEKPAIVTEEPAESAPGEEDYIEDLLISDIMSSTTDATILGLPDLPTTDVADWAIPKLQDLDLPKSSTLTKNTPSPVKLGSTEDNTSIGSNSALPPPPPSTPQNTPSNFFKSGIDDAIQAVLTKTSDKGGSFKSEQGRDSSTASDGESGLNTEQEKKLSEAVVGHIDSGKVEIQENDYLLTDSQINCLVDAYAPGVSLSQKSIRSVRTASICAGMVVDDSSTATENQDQNTSSLLVPNKDSRSDAKQ